MSGPAERWTAFASDPAGGNPAGVVLDARGLDDDAQQRIAREVGFSETAFVVARPGEERVYDVRYFAPAMEVPFCGHATIATGVALAERDGPGDVALHTRAGLIRVRTQVDATGTTTATLTSVTPAVEELPPGDLEVALAALDWDAGELDPALPPRIAFAGARHLVLAAATRARLAALDYDFDALRAFMAERDLITVQLVWREGPAAFSVRDPFPVGGVVEDPATGAAAAAFGAYLRALGLVTPPATVTLHQGDDLGRPSVLEVAIPPGDAGIDVTGTAVRLP
jgi:PhzF family phenazine biosynthesis protein